MVSSFLLCSVRKRREKNSWQIRCSVTKVVDSFSSFILHLLVVLLLLFLIIFFFAPFLIRFWFWAVCQCLCFCFRFLLDSQTKQNARKLIFNNGLWTISGFCFFFLVSGFFICFWPYFVRLLSWFDVYWILACFKGIICELYGRARRWQWTLNQNTGDELK